ncbi:inositol monophosphatase family protein [Paenibacillus dendritiformis]|uniref:inositol monophosphatase family protein n=1 Tax=Paenibacillus dendritiformis TaxID=130049 RepID=UPI000DA9268C|nr:inositol monophosphatase [Paenibacillus dendritiformis]PZM65206.1 inositol monophosphatase [Paenibacillus dendritiformis]
MNRTILHEAKEVAVNAAQAAGAIIKRRFDTMYKVDEKGDAGDVVTEADYEAEQAIVEAIERKFPDHRILSEEAGQLGQDSDWLWLVDPLDGTNNYVIGLPVFAVSITLMYREEPVLGVIYEPMPDRLYIAVKGEGMTLNGEPVRMRRHERELRRATAGWIQGHAVGHEQTAAQLRQKLDQSCKRMLRLWAPTLVWCMLARGMIDAIVLYNSEGEDLYSGVLMVQEAGGQVMDFQGRPFRTMCREPYLIACSPEAVQPWLELVRQGMQEQEA